MPEPESPADERSAARRPGEPGPRRWLSRFRRSKPVRVVRNYLRHNGPLLAAGLSFNSLFATFAALWLGFSVGGLLLEAEPTLRDAVFRFMNRAVPGLIDTGEGGAIDSAALLGARVLGWTGAVALVGLFVTALGWLAASRVAIRTIFRLERAETNVVVLKLKDVGLAIGFGLAVLVSAGLTIVGTQALGLFRPYIGSYATELGARIVGLTVMFLFDAAVLMSLFRILAGIRIPFRRLVGGVLIGALGLALLKVLGSSLLVGATRNPLLASFAVVVGLMLWFNLISQVMLLAASWIAVSARDHGSAVSSLSPSKPGNQREPGGKQS